jgi:hypothetical protein
MTPRKFRVSYLPADCNGIRWTGQLTSQWESRSAPQPLMDSAFPPTSIRPSQPEQAASRRVVPASNQLSV